DVVRGDGLLALVLVLVRLPDGGGEEDAVAVDDGAGPAGAGHLGVHLAAAVQLGLPQDVLAALGVPLQRQTLFLAVALAGRTAPARPVAGEGGAGESEK